MLLMGLRLMEGVDLGQFQKEAGLPFSAFVNENRVKTLEQEGLLYLSTRTVAATPRGRQRLNAVLAYLLS